MPAEDHSRQDRLLEVCRLLSEEAVEYVVIGGYACLLHGVVRTTKDVDIGGLH